MLIHELTLQGILSFGPETPPLEMRPLNVLIGPNGSGKSNLLSAISLLRASATKLAAPIRSAAGGGVEQWMHYAASDMPATIEAVIDNFAVETREPAASKLRHRIQFGAFNQRFEVIDESILSDKPVANQRNCYYEYRSGHPAIYDKTTGALSEMDRASLAIDESILSQRKDPEHYPELDYLSNAYQAIRIYRDWSFGRSSPLRQSQPADVATKPLEEDFSNLAVFLNSFKFNKTARSKFFERIQDLYDGLVDFQIKVEGNRVQLNCIETNSTTEDFYSIPATRLSDGTLRYLTLLAILCDPDPPPLICIEEPELGLHPDLLPNLGNLLIDASERTQLIVTTHSDMLIDSLSDNPESVVVVEKHDGCTELRRLENDKELQSWIQKYNLGESWSRGLIGGNRW